MTHAVTVVRLPYDGRQQTVSRVLTVVAREDLDLSQRLHDTLDGSGLPLFRPYSVVRYPDALHVCCFDDAVARALLRGEPAAVLVTRTSEAEITAPGDEGRTIRLAFTTPTAFRVMHADHLLPDPSCLFEQLRQRWDALGWPLLPLQSWGRLPTWPEELRFTSMPKAGRQRRGFVGSVRYECTPTQAAERASLWTLARFAEYAGVGQGTTYGMGRVRILRASERWVDSARQLSAWDRPPARTVVD